MGNFTPQCLIIKILNIFKTKYVLLFLLFLKTQMFLIILKFILHNVLNVSYHDV
jgi:hypothetical protein